MSVILHISLLLLLFSSVIDLSHQQQQQQYPQASFAGSTRLKISSLIKVQDDEPLLMVPIKTSNLSLASFKNVDIVPESRLFGVYFDSAEQTLHVSQKNKQSQEFVIGNNQGIDATSSTRPPQIETAAIDQASGNNVTDQDISNQSNSTVSTTQEPVLPTSTTSQDISNNETLIATTMKPILDPQPPVASKIIRQGADIFCGEANKKGNSSDRLIQTRIVGGSKSVPGEFPFQVRLNIMSKRGSGICGGVILDDRHILTAAHCMTACNSRQLTTATIETDGIHATVGDHSIRFEDGEVKVDIEKIMPHEKYDACNFYANDHDIAILRTKDVIQYKFTNDGYGSVNRPCLPVRNQVYREGEPVIVSGWGVTRENSGSLSNVLRYVQVPVVSISRCKETYGSRVTNDHICAGFVSGGKDSCQGDSGGPLVRIMDNRYQLVGIVSFGYGCGQPLAPGVYTKVSSYMDWIQSNILSSY